MYIIHIYNCLYFVTKCQVNVSTCLNNYKLVEKLRVKTSKNYINLIFIITQKKITKLFSILNLNFSIMQDFLKLTKKTIKPDMNVI